MSRLSKYLPFAALMSRLDHYLLINHRMIWISKIHYVLYATSLVTLPLTLAALLVPITLRTGVPDWTMVHWFTTVLGVMGGIYWVYRQSLFNFGRQFGNRPHFMAFSILALYMPCITALVGMTLLPWYVIQWRGAVLVSGAELEKDICVLSHYDFYFMTSIEYDSMISDSRQSRFAEEFDIGDFFEQYGWVPDMKGFTKRRSFTHIFDKRMQGCIITCVTLVKEVFDQYPEFKKHPEPEVLNHYPRVFRKYGGQIEDIYLTAAINTHKFENEIDNSTIDQNTDGASINPNHIIALLKSSKYVTSEMNLYYLKLIYRDFDTNLTQILNDIDTKKGPISGESAQKLLNEKIKVDQRMLSLRLSKDAFLLMGNYLGKWIMIVYFIAACVGTLIVMGLRSTVMVLASAAVVSPLIFVSINMFLFLHAVVVLPMLLDALLTSKTLPRA